jgi:hypothetical protein
MLVVWRNRHEPEKQQSERVDGCGRNRWSLSVRAVVRAALVTARRLEVKARADLLDSGAGAAVVGEARLGALARV